MRIISGTFGRRRIARVKDPGTRPTLDRVRESLFAILTPRLEDARVVDFFAGTGSLGIESISRGAARAVFVDINREALRIICRNLMTLGITGRQAEVLRLPALAAIARLRRKKEKFDLIFLDPPYGKGYVPDCLEALEDGQLMAKGGWIIAEHFKKEAIPERCGRLVCFRRKDYGDVALSFFRLEATAQKTPGMLL